MGPWEEVASEMFSHIVAIKKFVKGYSYQDLPSSLRTDERICEFFVKSLGKAKRNLFSISDLCFSLQTGDAILPLTDVMRDELDILGDEVQARHCKWKDIPPEFMKKIIKHDLDLLERAELLARDIELLFKVVLAETKKNSRPGKEFWKSFRKSLLSARGEARELVILFRERETICNITPLTLDRSLKKIQEEIREKI